MGEGGRMSITVEQIKEKINKIMKDCDYTIRNRHRESEFLVDSAESQYIILSDLLEWINEKEQDKKEGDEKQTKNS